MTPADHANTIREGWLEHSPISDIRPMCGECGMAMESSHRDGCHVPAAEAALDALQAQAEAASAVDWKAVAKDYETQAEAAEAERDELRATLDITHDTNAKLEAERDLLAETIAGDMGWRAQVDQAEYSLNHCRGLLDVVEAERDRLTDNIASDKLFIKNLLAERDRLADALREVDELQWTSLNVNEAMVYTQHLASAALDRTEQP